MSIDSDPAMRGQASPTPSRAAQPLSMRPQLLIIWHSRTGGSARLADVATAAARQEDGVMVLQADAAIVEPTVILSSAAFLFVCPENLASLSGTMKEMFDRCYYPCLGAIVGRAYATIVCAGSDGQGAQRQIDRIATGWRLRRVAAPLTIITGAQTAAAIAAPKTIATTECQRAAELGASLAAGLVLGIF